MSIVTKTLQSAFVLLFFLCLSSHLYAQPTISSFSPSTGLVGNGVVINGTNFSPIAANNIVYFGAVKAYVSTATSTALTVVVPYGTTYEPITVTTNGLTAYSAKPFIATFPDGGTITSNSFEDKTELSAGESPYDIATCDLDGDRKPDMVVVNSGYPYSISIYKNTSAAGIISFANKLDILTGNGPSSVVISDIDGDGKPDIVVTNNASFSISVFRNIGTPGNISFATRVDFPAQNPDVVVAGDLNKDGKPDLVITNYVAHSISIYNNISTPGNVSFAARTDYPTGQYPSDVSMGDIDGDSWLDVVVANERSDYLSIFKNNAAPQISFTVNNNLLPGVASASVILTDVDGDNKPDLAVNKGSNLISVYRNLSNPGNIAFPTSLDFDITDNPIGFAAADLDGDGKPDLTAACGSGSIGVLKNTSSTGSISFQNNVGFLPGNGASDLSIVDFDEDGKPDIVAIDQAGNAVLILRNQVDGPHITSFSPTAATTGAPVTITGARFTGITQVHFGNVPARSFTVVSPSTIQAEVGEGANGEVRVTGVKGTAKAKGFNYIVPPGPFPVPVVTTFTPASGPIGTTVTITGKNFNSIPANNIVYFGATSASVVAASATSLTVQVPTGATYAPISVTTNKLTGSSTLPFVTTFETGPAFTSNSLGSPKLFDQNEGSHIAHADIDGDGKTDIVYGWLIAALNTSTIHSISFAAPQEVLPGVYGGLFEFGDIDSDGKQDLVRITTNYNATLSVLKNQSSAGTVSFRNAVSAPIPDLSSSFAIKDLDTDGKPDLIIANYDKDIFAIFRNNSYASVIQFDAKIEAATGDGPAHVSSGDLDGDGKPEVIITNNTENSISIFPNNSVPGSISLGAKLTYKALAGPAETALADLDGDGKLDIAVVTHGGNQVLIFKNTSTTGSISFSLPTTFSTYVFPTRIRAADMDGDGKPDLAVFNGSANSIFKNTSNTTTISFGHEVYYPTEHMYGDMEIGDFDGDGKSDIVVGVDRTGIGILENKVGTAKTVPAGANPVKGLIRNSMTVDQTVQAYNGNPYVQRHYDIEPVDNPGTSTATVTLYFTQQDFDNFNAFPGHGANLPANPNDNSGKANLRVYQYHGFSATSLPGSYNGFGIEIDPVDANIVWNVRANCWEVSFPVTGFSGFFVSNASFSSILPPVITAGSGTSFCQGGHVVLSSSAITGNQWYKDGMLIPGANQSTFQANAGGVYTATMTVNGNPSLGSNSIAVTVTTTPVQPVISSDGTILTSSSTAGNQWYREGFAITGAVNQTYKPLNAANYTVTVTSNGCISPFSAGYYFVPVPVITTGPGTIICPGKSVVLTSSALSNNQWYKDGVAILGAIDRTYQPTQAGSYTATTSVNNITSGTSNSIAVTANAGPAKPVITVNGANLESSATSGNQWYESGNPITGATNKTYKPLTNGNYSVITTDPSTNCSTESEQVYFTVTGIINIDNTHYIKLSPNPVVNEMLLDYRLSGITNVHLQLIDLRGHVYGNYSKLASGSKLSLSGIAKGIYLAKITDTNSKKSYTIKLVKL